MKAGKKAKKNKKKSRKNAKKSENKAKIHDFDENIQVGGGWHPSYNSSMTSEPFEPGEGSEENEIRDDQ